MNLTINISVLNFVMKAETLTMIKNGGLACGFSAQWHASCETTALVLSSIFSTLDYRSASI